MKTLRGELDRWAQSGMTGERYQLLLPKVSSNVAPLPISASTVGDLRSRLTTKVAEASSSFEALKVEFNQIKQALEVDLKIQPKDNEKISATAARLHERITNAQTLIGGLSKVFKRLPWPNNRALTELLVTVTSLRSVAADFQMTAAKERQVASALTAATARKKQIDQQLAGLRPRIERLREAQEVLGKILTEYSLQSAVENALKLNRAAIEAIFRRIIHSPAEFSGLGETMTTLVRKKGGTASLKQISTGQRSAFALSLFLAQNAQATNAPPIVLIDDPIAHVDDLNCLSFLDYLRELIVEGGKQVFFATASEKLAALFERKFDFLGAKNFCRYQLER